MWEPWDEFDADKAGAYGEGEYAQGYYDDQGNLIGVLPGTEMAAFQEESVLSETIDVEGEETFGRDHPDLPDEDPDDPDDGPGGAGVREPRRPLPGAPFTVVEIDPDEST